MNENSIVLSGEVTRKPVSDLSYKSVRILSVQDPHGVAHVQKGQSESLPGQRGASDIRATLHG